MFSGVKSAVVDAAATVVAKAADAGMVSPEDFNKLGAAADSDMRDVQTMRKKVDEEFGKETLQALDTLDGSFMKVEEELKYAKDHKAGLMLSLALLHLHHDDIPTPSTVAMLRDGKLAEELRYWLEYAMGAYGLEAAGANTDAAKVGKALQGRAEVKVAALPAKGVLVPGHYVAIDYSRRSVVLGVRGPWSIFDAIAEATGEAVALQELEGQKVHKDFLTQARTVLEKVKDPLEAAFKEWPKFDLVVTGHSSGGGVAILCSILLKKSYLKERAVKIRCFTYGAPPVISPLEMKTLEMYAVVNANDLVPRASLQNLAYLGREALSVDRLGLTLNQRTRLVQRGDLPEDLSVDKQKVVSAVDDVRMQRINQPLTSLPLLVVPGKLLWIETGKKVEDAEDSQQTQTIFHVEAQQAFGQLTLKDVRSALKDHLCSSYQDRLDAWKVKLEKDHACIKEVEPPPPAPEQSCCSVQ